MPGNDNILAQLSLGALAPALPPSPRTSDPEVSAWLEEVRKVTEESLGEAWRSLSLLRNYVSQPTRQVDDEDYTATDEDFIILVDAATAARTVTLPLAANSLYHIYVVKRLNSAANDVIVARSGSDTIDGAASYTIDTQYKAINLTSDGTEWWVF